MTVAAYRRTVRESDMERAVSDLVALKGGRMWHVRRSDVAPELADLPDWLILAPWLNAVILAEAKSVRRNLTEGQANVMAMLTECGKAESFVVRASAARDETETDYDTFLRYLNGKNR